MFRTAGIALLSLLTIGVAVVGFGGWQLQRPALRAEELSEQLASLTTTQQAMLAARPARDRRPGVLGRSVEAGGRRGDQGLSISNPGAREACRRVRAHG